MWCVRMMKVHIALAAVRILAPMTFSPTKPSSLVNQRCLMICIIVALTVQRVSWKQRRAKNTHGHHQEVPHSLERVVGLMVATHMDVNAMTMAQTITVMEMMSVHMAHAVAMYVS